MYTFIVNYKDGTYVSQINNNSELDEAIKGWYNNFENENILNDKTLNEIKERLASKEFKPLFLNGLENVWCNDLGYIDKKYFSMTIVKYCINR